MLLTLLLLPLFGIFMVSSYSGFSANLNDTRRVGLTISTLNFLISLFIWILFDFSQNQFQFVKEYHQVSFCDLYLGVDGLSSYFVILTAIIIPTVLLSNWYSIRKNIMSYIVITLLLQILLLAVFLALDVLLFYVFFESILPPLFLLIGLFGSDNKVRASLYLFLYTLLGSLFLLLAILIMSFLMGTTDFDVLFKTCLNYSTQILLFYGIFFSFAVKTPTIFLNTWLLKAHVESPLGGSIILAGKTVPASNIAISWKHQIDDIWSISWKLFALCKSCFNNIFWEKIILISNIIDFFGIIHFNSINIKLNSILRGHTLKVINLNTNYSNDKNKNLGSYFAGLIEGDGAIYIPKNNKNASMIIITFNSKDLPLILTIQKTLNIGNVYKIKGKNAYTYSISDIKGLIKSVNLINGYMRTPKIVQLYKLIDWINNKSHNISKLPLDDSLFNSNAWLSGFIEADGCFYVRVTQNNHCSTKKIACMLELAQKTTNLNNDSLLSVMTIISDFLLSKLKIKTKNDQYLIRTSNLQSNLILKEYINSYPLFSSKHLDSLIWVKILNMMVNKEHQKNLETIIKLKKNMNSRRTYFNWNHLNNFYSYFE